MAEISKDSFRTVSLLEPSRQRKKIVDEKYTLKRNRIGKTLAPAQRMNIPLVINARDT